MTVVFETERLNLRHLQENDGDDFYKFTHLVRF
jgi:hypothetical protein